MTPAEELHAAAQRLEELAGQATPGRWWPDRELVKAPPWSGSTLPTWPTQVVAVADAPGGGVQREQDAAWIAALGPQAAAPLVAWLRDAAEFRGLVEQAYGSDVSMLRSIGMTLPDQPGGGPVVAPNTLRALEFARVINGTAP